MVSQAAPALLLAVATVFAGVALRPAPPSLDFTEPRQRARITVGEECVDLDVGGGRAQLADGREVRVDLLATRRFVAAQAFSFEYPSAWSFSAASGAPTGMLGWWSMAGPGGMVHLQRHDGDALEVRDTYAANLERSGSASRRACALELDGRRLEGWEVDTQVSGMLGYPTTPAVQQVYGWKEREGVAWLFVVQRDVSESIEAPLTLDEAAQRAHQVLLGGQDRTSDFSRLGESPTVDVVLTTFRWNK